ncbi:MAG TPA: MFS transporter, partial [Burkholderiaceae bacterium]|nr:MFS transporter [Burkholderiaceae bacterium]
DIAPGPERGRYQGYLAGMFAIAAVAGPVLGGYLSWYISWRAIFWFTVPIAISAFLISRRALALLPVPGHRRPIDYAGALLLGIGLAAVLIALTRIGQGHGWTSSSTLALVGTGALALFACALRERVAPEPMLPPELFVNRRVLLCCMLYVLVFFLLVGHSVLLPIWMQALGGAGANDVALRMLPLTLGVPAGAYASGRLVLRLERCRPIIVAGALLAIAGSVMLALVEIDSLFAGAAVMLVLGLGMGLTMPASIVELQAAVAPRQVGIATAVGALEMLRNSPLDAT